ncbi:hypothetical protein C8J57DRAFT_1674556 [Mycena rebaudengoi]|nr:hypothetical protein C8J57DRAFT_1674556 [Mycena rebaudengoi]
MSGASIHLDLADGSRRGRRKFPQQVRQARERTQARPGGVVEGREVVVQELQVRGAREEGLREAGGAGEEVDDVEAQAREGREARRVDRAVAREVMHGAADGEDFRDVGDWGAHVQHQMLDEYRDTREHETRMASVWRISAKKNFNKVFSNVPRMNSVRDEQQPRDVLVVENRSGLEYHTFQPCRENHPAELHEGGD